MAVVAVADQAKMHHREAAVQAEAERVRPVPELEIQDLRVWAEEAVGVET
jgi:hypothetical protein